MAKKSKKKEDETKKVVAKCDNPNEVVANCDQSKELVVNHDQLDDVVEITPEEEIDIAKLIVVVRDQRNLYASDCQAHIFLSTKKFQNVNNFFMFFLWIFKNQRTFAVRF